MLYFPSELSIEKDDVISEAVTESSVTGVAVSVVSSEIEEISVLISASVDFADFELVVPPQAQKVRTNMIVKSMISEY